MRDKKSSFGFKVYVQYIGLMEANYTESTPETAKDTGISDD
jgi:hypothetical protein